MDLEAAGLRRPTTPQGKLKCFATLTIEDATTLTTLMYRPHIDGNIFFMYHVTSSAIDGLLFSRVQLIDFDRIDMLGHLWPIEYRMGAFVEWTKLRKLVFRLLWQRWETSTNPSERWICDAFGHHFRVEIEMIYSQLPGRIACLTAPQKRNLSAIWSLLDHMWWTNAGVEPDVQFHRPLLRTDEQRYRNKRQGWRNWHRR